MDIKERIAEHLRERAIYLVKKILPWIEEDYIGSFCIAGGSMVGTPNDIDLFPCRGSRPPSFKGEIVSKTKNATTYKCEPWPVQVCTYTAPTIGELVESFDFSHIQAGAEVELHKYTIASVKVAFTDAYVIAKTTDQPEFTGSKYPLSAMLRAGKYFKRGAMTKGQYMVCVLSALTSTIERGFQGYDDFKDQLDAVDLGLVPEDIEKALPALRRLFELLDR